MTTTTRTLQDIKADAAALRDLHATTCAAVADGADCMGGSARASQFKGRIKGSGFRTLEAAAEHCREFDAALAALRSEYMQASGSLGKTWALGYAIAFGVNAPQAGHLNR